MEEEKLDKDVCMKGGGVLFIGINVAFFFLHGSMLCYHGGSRFSLEPVQFTFTRNFLSELGSISFWNGALNIGSRILFNLGIIFAVGCFICYLRHFPGNFLPHTKSRNISRVGNICSIIALVGFIGVLCIPRDLNWILHLIMALTAFGGIPLIFLSYGFAGLFSHQFPKILTFLLFSIFLGMLIYFLSMLLGPNYFSEEGVHFHIIAQKLGVSFIIIVLSLIGWITFRWELQSKTFTASKSKSTIKTNQEERVSLYLILLATRIHLQYRKKLLLEQRRLILPPF